MKYIKIIIKSIAGFILLFALISIILVSYSKFVIENDEMVDISPVSTNFMKISDSEEIAYQEINNDSSTTIVFVGGLSGWSATWERSMLELDKNLKSNNIKYNLLAIDLPPFGFSRSDLSADFYRSTQAQRIHDFLQKKGVKDLIFVAHSYGAGPVTEVVMSYSDSLSITKLVIIDGVLNIDEIKQVEVGNKKSLSSLIVNKSFLNYFILMGSHSEALVKNRLATFVHITENINDDLVDLYTAAFTYKHNSRRLAGWLSDYVTDPLVYKSTQSKYYKELNIPVRIIWGDKDTLTPITLAYELLDLVPDSKLHTLNNVGHIPMIEDYQQFDSALTSAIIE